MRIKIKTFLPEFNYPGKLISIFLLMFFFYSPSLVHSQVMGKYDSLFIRINSGNIPDDTIKIGLLYELAVAASRAGIQDHIERGKEIGNAVFYYHEALKLSVKLNYEYGKKLFYQTISTIYNQNTDLPVLGLTDMDDGIYKKKFKEFYYYSNKKHFGSIDTYIRVQNTLKEMEADEQAYLLDYWIGLAYYDWFNYNRAIKHFNSAVKSDGIKSDSIILSDVYQCIGAAYYYKGLPDSAIIHFNNSLEILNKKVEYPLKSGICLNNLGEVYFKKSDFVTASSYFKSSLDQFLLNGDSTYIAFSLAELGQTYTRLRKFEPSWNALSRSVNISSALKEKSFLGKAYLNLHELNLQKGDFQKAYYYQNEYYQIKESLLIDELAGYFSSYEADWQNDIGREITKKESEALKRSETTIELNKSRLFLLAMGLFVITVLVVATYTYRLYKLKQKANDYLTELNRSREKLLSIISHDVRGPIIGFIDLLEPLNQKINTLSTSQISGYIKQIINLSQSIKLLVDNLLEWTKAQQGMIMYVHEILQLHEVIRRDIQIYKQVADSKGIKLTCFIQPEVNVMGDRNMINIIVRNLLNNAVKYTKKGDEISVDAERENDKIVVSVTDTGIGMGKDQAEAIFNKGKSINDYGINRKNSGLGLLLCKEYVEKCNGEIWVISEGKDAGSTFCFTLNSAEKHG